MTQVAASVAEHDQESSFPPRNQRREDSQIIAHYRRVSLESVQRLLIVFRASKLGGSVAGLMKTVGKVLPDEVPTLIPPRARTAHLLERLCCVHVQFYVEQFPASGIADRYHSRMFKLPLRRDGVEPGANVVGAANSP